MSLPTYQPLPPQFTAGDTVLVRERYSDYPAGTWTAKMWFSTGTGTPTGVDATTSDGDFLFTLSSTFTGALTGLDYFVSVVVTNAGEKKTPLPARSVLVLPNFAVAQTATTAQTMVAALQNALASFANSSQQSVSFNGQSFSRANITDYQRQLVYWESRVIAEQARLERARGGPDPSRIANEFLPGDGGPWVFPFGAYRVQ